MATCYKFLSTMYNNRHREQSAAHEKGKNVLEEKARASKQEGKSLVTL